MNQRVFAYRSGVVVDHCQNHGIWLDSGEITHLMEWEKAGGQLLHERAIGVEKRTSHYKMIHDYTDTLSHHADKSLEIDIFEAVVSLVKQYFID